MSTSVVMTPFFIFCPAERKDAMKQILSLLYIGYLFFVILLIFFSRKKPTQRFSWILVLIFLPVVGLIVYSLMGSEMYWDYKRSRIRQRHRATFLELDTIVGQLHNPQTQSCPQLRSSTTSGAAAFLRIITEWKCLQTAGRSSLACSRI